MVYFFVVLKSVDLIMEQLFLFVNYKKLRNVHKSKRKTCQVLENLAGLSCTLVNISQFFIIDKKEQLFNNQIYRFQHYKKNIPRRYLRTDSI